MKQYLLRLLRTVNKPLPAWATLMLLAGCSVVYAATTTFYGQVVSSAAITPSPVPTGYYGPAVIAQATALPTIQTGRIDVSNSIDGGTIRSGYGTGITVTAGDGSFGETASSGAIDLGGSSSSAMLDYGVTTASAASLNAPLASTYGTTGLLGELTPSYTAAGAACGVNCHTVSGFGANADTVTVGSNCAAYTSCTLSTGSPITLATPNPGYTSATSFACFAEQTNSLIFTMGGLSNGYTISVALYNTSASTINAGTSYTMAWSCTGD